MSDEVATRLAGHAGDDGADRIPRAHRLGGAPWPAAGLQLGEDLLDWSGRADRPRGNQRPAPAFSIACRRAASFCEERLSITTLSPAANLRGRWRGCGRAVVSPLSRRRLSTLATEETLADSSAARDKPDRRGRFMAAPAARHRRSRAPAAAGSCPMRSAILQLSRARVPARSG